MRKKKERKTIKKVKKRKIGKIGKRKKRKTGKEKEYKEIIEEKPKIQEYIETIGRRKTSMSRVRFYLESKDKEIIINKKELENYFPEFELQKIILAPLEKTNSLNKYRIEILAKGGGKRGQAEAIKLGLSRALIKINPKFKEILSPLGYLRRDPRKKERKKFGFKKARKAPQWQKR